jgi:membrane protein CcdC involved in cytochrome C biogenesis
MTIFLAIFMVLTRFCNQGRPVDKLKVVAPPPMNTVEQLLAVQNAISQAEQFIQDGNIILLKFRALLLSIFPQVTLYHSPCGPACLIFSNFNLLHMS